MENLNIGRSGIEVPFLGMGTWAIGGGSWWGDNDDALSVKAIQTAVEQGIRWIDTAPIYGLYHSETVVGEALKHIDRDKVVLSTKCGLEWRHETPVLHKVVDGTAVYRDLSAQSIIEDVEDSLRRLGTDHLDVLYTHWQSPDLGLYPLEETVEAMMKLKEQGKIRAIGASNVTADLIRGYCRYGQLDVIQEKYSPAHPPCGKAAAAVPAGSWGVSGAGILSAGAGPADRQGDHGNHLSRGQHPQLEPQLPAGAPLSGAGYAGKWSDLTEKYDCSLAQLVIRPDRPHDPRPACAVRCPHSAAGNGQRRCAEHQTGRCRCRPHEVGRGCHFLSRCFRTKEDNQKGTMPQKHRPFLVICAPSAGRGSHRLRWPPG